jgi:hypothetical protein
LFIQTIPKYVFNLVVFSKEELHFWNPHAQVDVLFPCVVEIHSKWEIHFPLLSSPLGNPKVANRRPDWKEKLPKAHRECIMDLNSARRAAGTEYWDDFFGTPDSFYGLYHQKLRVELWPHALIPCSRLSTPPTASERVRSQTTRATSGSSMRSTQAETRPTPRTTAFPTLNVLQPQSFAFVQVDGDYVNNTGLHLCVVQISDVPDDLDTTNPTPQIPVKWWKPNDDVEPSYSNKWTVWFCDNRREQDSTPIVRTMIYTANLRVFARSVCTGALNRRWLKLNAASINIGNAYETEFSSSDSDSEESDD